LPTSECLALVGTYLTINTDGSGDDTSTARSLISITNGGHMFFTDSAEGGTSEFAPFTDARGAWRCMSNDDGVATFNAIVLDFTDVTPSFPDQQIGRLDVTGTFDESSETLSGTMALYLFPMEANPLAEHDLTPDYSGDYTAERIVVP
jgi:hypothetical protein